MKLSSTIRVLGALLIAAFGVVQEVYADPQGRRRGVARTQAISGVVLEYDTSALLLRNEAGDYTLRITTQTRFQGEISVAAQVEVRYVKNDADEMVAVSVSAKPELVELHGVIQELLSDGFVAITDLGEVTIRVDESTVILIDGARATLTDLALGDRVEVDAVPVDGGEYLALVVFTESSVIELQGRISAISEDSLTIDCLTRSTEVGLTDETIVRLYGYDATIADLSIGMCATVYATRLDDGSLQALLVDVSKGFNLDEINGIVATASETELVVLARQGEVFTFAIMPDTMIVRRNESIAASDITPGEFVQVKALDSVTLGAIAIRIRVEDPGLHYRDVTGVIARIDGSLLTLTLADGSEVDVLIDSRTIIRVGREQGSVADLVPGKSAEVHFWRNPDESHAAIAVKIVILDDGAGELVIDGTVVSADPGLLTVRTARVGELGFIVNDATVVTRGGVVLELADVQPGDHVEVHAVSDANGILTATRIEVDSAPPVVEPGGTEGDVTAVSPESITLEVKNRSVTFVVTTSTVVLINGATASIADVQVGDHARIESETEKGEKIATKIEVYR